MWLTPGCEPTEGLQLTSLSDSNIREGIGRLFEYGEIQPLLEKYEHKAFREAIRASRDETNRNLSQVYLGKLKINLRKILKILIWWPADTACSTWKCSFMSSSFGPRCSCHHPNGTDGPHLQAGPSLRPQAAAPQGPGSTQAGELHAVVQGGEQTGVGRIFLNRRKKISRNIPSISPVMTQNEEPN